MHSSCLSKRNAWLYAAWKSGKKYARTVAPLKPITPHKLRSTYGTSCIVKQVIFIWLQMSLVIKMSIQQKKHYAAIEEDRRRSAAKYVHLRED